MLDDAELLLGMSRHLSAYGISSAHAALDSIQFAGQVYELAWRLRNAGLSPAGRIEAISIEAAIGRRILLREVLPTLEQLGWIECRYDDQQRLLSVDAFIPPPGDLVAAAPGLLDIVAATPVQRAALALLRATTLQPLEESSALDAAASFGDEVAIEGLRHLQAIQLVRKVTGDDGRTVVFNPNVWAGNEDAVMRAALRAEDAGARANVGALLDEVAQSPGIPEVHVTATDKRWIDFAVSIGLIQRSVVQTTGGDEQRFLFSPHMGRDPFGTAANDPSGHVRQLVGSMIYASTFAATNKLRSPGAFLYKLIRDGVAGDVPEIGEDYPMLETAGTIRVVPGSWQNSYQMELLQSDVAEKALAILDARGQSRTPGSEPPPALGDQRSYTHLEKERARLAQAPVADEADTRRLVDALRDTARRSAGGR